MAEYDVHKGYKGGLGIKKESVAGTADTPPSLHLEIESETMTETINHATAAGINGSRTRSKHRNFQGTKEPGGGFRLNGVKPDDLSLLLELLLGNYGSGTGYTGDGLPSFTTVLNVPPRYDVYAGCKLSSGQFESSEDDQTLKFDAEAVAMSFAEGDSGDWGTPSYNEDAPLVHRRLTFTVGGDSLRVKRWQLRVENALDDQKFYNSQTRLVIPENDDRTVAGEVGLDQNAANYTAVMDKWRNGTYAELRAEYTNGAKVVTFVCPNCWYPTERAQIEGKGVIAMPATYEAYGSGPGNNDEIQIYVRNA